MGFLVAHLDLQNPLVPGFSRRFFGVSPLHCTAWWRSWCTGVCRWKTGVDNNENRWVCFRQCNIREVLKKKKNAVSSQFQEMGDFGEIWWDLLWFTWITVVISFYGWNFVWMWVLGWNILGEACKCCFCKVGAYYTYWLINGVASYDPCKSPYNWAKQVVALVKFLQNTVIEAIEAISYKL